MSHALRLALRINALRLALRQDSNLSIRQLEFQLAALQCSGTALEFHVGGALRLHVLTVNGYVVMCLSRD